MKNLYDFITSLCKNRDMKLEELQKKLKTSRTTLYRYMKGINQITSDLEREFIKALNMDKQEAITFSKFVSLSSFDQTLIESRYELDGFLFGGSPPRKSAVDIDMVFYNNDKYLRTLREVLDFILSFAGKENLSGVIKIMNCLDENLYIQLADFWEQALAADTQLEIEHYVSLSETDYLQNTYSFINLFPLMKHERYRLYFREKDTDDGLANDSLLISFICNENGNTVRQYFSLSFYDDGMPECIAFTDSYMHSFLSKWYENLKHSCKNVIQKHERFDFQNDLLTELSSKGSTFIIKPNPCYDKIPYEAYKSLTGRASKEEVQKFLSVIFGQELEPEAAEYALTTAMKYIKNRIDMSHMYKQIDVYSVEGLTEFAETGKITDHLEHFPAFSREEIRMCLEYLLGRDDDPEDDYRLCVTKNHISRNDLIIVAVKGYGIVIEYIYPERGDGLWKTLLIESKRLAMIFSDYIENYIPANHALPKDEADRYIRDLIDKLDG